MLGHDGFFARLTRFKRAFPGIEPKATLLLFQPVTFETMLFQQRTHFAGKIRGAPGVGDGFRQPRGKHQDHGWETHRAPDGFDPSSDSHESFKTAMHVVMPDRSKLPAR